MGVVWDGMKEEESRWGSVNSLQCIRFVFLFFRFFFFLLRGHMENRIE